MNDQRIYEVAIVITSHWERENPYDLLRAAVPGVRFPANDPMRLGFTTQLFVHADSPDEANSVATLLVQSALGDHDRARHDRHYAYRIDEQPREVIAANAPTAVVELGAVA